MSQFRFAFLIMAGDHDSARHVARLETDSCRSVIVGVSSLDDACARARELVASGEVDHIELCGAFGEDGARAVSRALGAGVPVGYIVGLEG